MTFDINNARKAGYSDNEIASYLAQQNPKFDYEGAKKAGYSDSEISQHLATAPVQQIDGVAREPLRAASGIAKSVASVAGIPGDVSNLVDRYVGAPLARKVIGLPADFGKPMSGTPLLTSDDITNSMQKAGLVNRPDLAPQNTAERYADYAYGALPYAAGAPLAGLPQALARNAGAGVGAGALTENKPSWLPAPVAAIGGAMLGGKVAGGIESTLERGVNSATGNLTPMAQAYKDAGITPQLSGTVSGSPMLKFNQAFAQKFPFLAAGKVEKASGNEMDQFGDAVENLAKPLGTSTTLQEAGTRLQSDGNKWLDTFKTNVGQKSNDLDTMIGSDTPVTLDNTQQTLDSIKSQGGNNKSAQTFLQSPLMGKFNDILDETQGNKPGYSLVTMSPTTTNPNPLTWQTLRALKTRVGEYLENPDLIADGGTAQAKRLYGALSTDATNAAMKSGNPDAVKAMTDFNQYTSNGHDFLENTLSPLIKTGVAPEDAASSVLATARKGDSTLAPLRAQMPDAVDELGAAKLRSASISGGTQDTSPTSFFNNFNPNTRMAPEAFNALYPDQDVQKSINALATIGAGSKSTEALVNHSNTMPGLAPVEGMDALAEGAKAGFENGGIKGAILGGLAGLSVPFGLGGVTGGLATNPMLTKYMSGAPASTAGMSPLYTAAIANGAPGYAFPATAAWNYGQSALPAFGALGGLVPMQQNPQMQDSQ